MGGPPEQQQQWGLQQQYQQPTTATSTTLILPPQNAVLRRLTDLKTYDAMLGPENWRQLRWAGRDWHLMWLVSIEYLADEQAARWMRSSKRSLRGWQSTAGFTYTLLHAAAAFRQWRCVEVVLGEYRGMWLGGLGRFRSPDLVLCHAILDAARGGPGCADGRIIRKLLRTDARSMEELKGFGVNDGALNDGPFRGGWFGWEPFRRAFVQRQRTVNSPRPPLV